MQYRFYSGQAFGHKEPHFQNDRCLPFTVFVYVCEGTYYCSAQGKELAIEQGETLVVPPHTYHNIMMKKEGRLHWAHISVTVDGNEFPGGRTAPYKMEGEASERIGRCLKKLNQAQSLPDEIHKNLLKDRYIAEIFELVFGMDKQQPIRESELDSVYRHIRRSPGEKYTLALLSAIAKMSERSFESKFKREYGITPMRYVAECRTKLAAFLLASGKSVKETAIEAGYYDSYHFSKCFKAAMGVSPSDYAKTHSLEI